MNLYSLSVLEVVNPKTENVDTTYAHSIDTNHRKRINLENKVNHNGKVTVCTSQPGRYLRTVSISLVLPKYHHHRLAPPTIALRPYGKPKPASRLVPTLRKPTT